MDFGTIANDLLDVLEQDIGRVPFLISQGRAYRRRGEWALATENAVKCHVTADLDISQGGDLWLAISHMYQGAGHFAQGEISTARGYFVVAEREFRRQRHCHGKLVALMAQARTWQFDREADPEMASDLFKRSELICAELEARASSSHLFTKVQVYANLRAKLRCILTKLRQSAHPRLVRELENIAGEPAYLLSDENSCETSRLFINEELLDLKSYEDARDLISWGLSHHVMYLVAKAQDAKMDGSLSEGHRINIRSGDRLLVEGQDRWPATETIGLFKEPPHSIFVAIFRRHPGGFVLASANPKYQDHNYLDSTATVRYLGKVMAILDEAD